MAAADEAFTSAGTTLHVSASAPSSENSAGYAALTWTAVGEIVDIGEFGRRYNMVAHNPIGTRRTRMLKGSYAEGELPLQLARAPGDAGQAMMITARDVDTWYSFKITLQDGTLLNFRAQVTAYTTVIGGVDSITSANASLAIQTDVLEVPPA